MSTIGVTYHNEDIHNIIKKPTDPIVKPPMYKSKKWKSIKDKPRKEGSCPTFMTSAKGKSKHQTLGLAHYEPSDSKNFLRKKTGHQVTPQVFSDELGKKGCNCDSGSVLPPLPKPKIERPKTGCKNFVKENIKWVGTLEPKTPCPRRVDSPRGTVKDLKHLIEMIKIREREEYGKVPEYLCTRKKQLEAYMEGRRRQEEIEKSYKEKMGIGNNGMDENLYMVDKETREKLLQGLKEHWNELSKQFLKLPVMCDTMTKIKRKIWLEKEIDRVEKDVKLVEGHPYIYLERTDKRRTSEIAREIFNEQERQRLAEEENVKNAEVANEAADDAKEEDKEVTVHNYEKET